MTTADPKVERDRRAAVAVRAWRLALGVDADDARWRFADMPDALKLAWCDVYDACESDATRRRTR